MANPTLPAEADVQGGRSRRFVEDAGDAYVGSRVGARTNDAEASDPSCSFRCAQHRGGARVNLDQLARLGTAVSGLTTAFGFILAWRGFNGWRHQKRAEYQAEAARKAYSALARTCDALARYAERPYLPGPELQGRRERAAAMHKLLDERRRDLAPVFEQLHAAEDAATLYLGAPYDSLFMLATTLERTVRTNAAMWSLHVSDGKEREAEEVFDSAFGSEILKSISSLRRQTRHALRPVARYHGSPLLQWVLASRLDAIVRRIDGRRRVEAPPQESGVAPSADATGA